MSHILSFSIYPEPLAVCQLPHDAPIPAWASADGFSCITRTPEELSIVCEEKSTPSRAGMPAPHEGNIAADSLRIEKGWIALKLEGPFPFTMTGVLASFLDPLAAALIPIFALSTFNTDYVLIKRSQVDAALRVLQDAGHRLRVSR